MRIHIKTTPSSNIVSFNHLHLLTGTLHKWFGKNDFHNQTSLYSFSGLRGGEFLKTGLRFENGATFFISCWNVDYAKLLIKGIQESPEMFCGMRVREIILQKTPDLTNKTHFQLGSPIFIQRNIENGNKRFYYYYDKEAGDLLKSTLETKMKKAGLALDNTLKIYFDQDYHKKGTKKLDYYRKDRINEIRANWCPVIIEGKPETKQFAWCVGLGNSTGIGFGSIK